MFFMKTLSLFICFFISILIILPIKVSALSASSSELILIVINSKHDVSLVFPEIEDFEVKKRNTLFAQYFTIYSEKIYENFNIKILNDDSSFIITLDKNSFSAPLTYSVIDFKNKSVLSERSTALYAFSVIITVILTIVCDCLILFWLGFRKIKSRLIIVVSGVIIYSVVSLWVYKSFPSVFIMAVTRVISNVLILPARVITFTFIPLEENVKSRQRTNFIIISSLVAMILNLLLLNVLPI